jgi:hypothetical protein
MHHASASDLSIRIFVLLVFIGVLFLFSRTLLSMSRFPFCILVLIVIAALMVTLPVALTPSSQFCSVNADNVSD